MCTKATLTDEAGNVKNILTFGPLCIESKYQRRGYGKLLIQHSFGKVASMGYDTLVPEERKHTPAQEEFNIMSHSFVE